MSEIRGEAHYFVNETPKALPQKMRDLAKGIAEINAMWGLPANAPMHVSTLRHKATEIEEGEL